MVSLLIENSGVLIVSFVIVNDSQIEICFWKLLCEQAFDLWKSFQFIFSYRFFEIYKGLLEIISLEVKTCQIKIGLNVICVKTESLLVYFDELAEDTNSFWWASTTKLDDRWLSFPLLDFFIIKHIL